MKDNFSMSVLTDRSPGAQIEEESMNETVAGLSQSISLYLIVIGGILIVILIILLLRMGKRREESIEGTSRPETEEREEVSGKLSEVSRSAEEEKEALSAPTVEVTGELSKEEESSVSALKVMKEPFEETPEIGREDFERFAGKHVLVVEDNPVNRKLILTLMAGSGIELDSAEDGNEALEKLRAPDAAFDLVLMDVNMPGMDGLECTRQIRQDPRLREIPVLALTASTTPEEVDRILGSGMNGYLDKPLELGKLYTAFLRFLEEYRVPREAEGTVSEVETDRLVFDPTVGLEHTNEDRTLFRSLLEDFLGQYSDSPVKFREMVQARDYEGIQRLVIDLEGLSGMLGAMELYRLLLSMNQILKKGTTMLLGDYAEEYAETFGRFEREARRYLAG
jgi:CheY-like chemotaxis protein